MKNEKLIKEAEAVNSAIEMLIDMKANEPWISFYIGKVWAYLDLIMNENADEDAVVESGLAAAAGNEEAAKSYELFKAGLYALRPVSRERSEEAWRGDWIAVRPEFAGHDHIGGYKCSRCKEEAVLDCNDEFVLDNFCPRCGAAMTDEAVEMVMERWEALHGETKTD